jgi:pimeloyl-ACP methyl ester carboxylesterase
MRSLLRRGVRTHYETIGAGPPVLLIHAFSGNHTSWIGYGFVERLQAHHQLILPDIRGHGASDGPSEPEAYRLADIADDLVAVLDNLGLEQVHAMGYSMGGVIGFALAQRHPQRLRSLVVGGASPYPPDGTRVRGFLLQLYERAVAEGVDTLVEGIRQWAGTISPAYEARLRGANLRAGAASLRWIHDNPPDFTALLPTWNHPCLVYCGAADDVFAEAQRAAEALPRACFVTLPGMNHVQAAGASAELVPHLLAFWASVDR